MEIKKVQLVRTLTQLSWLLLTYFAIFNEGNTVFHYIVLALAAILGVMYCGWLCVFGTLQDAIGALGQKVLKKRYKLPENIHKFLKWFRYVLILAVVIPFLSIFINYDGKMIFFMEIFSGWMITAVGITIVSFYLILSFFVDRPFCNYMCPEGAKYGLLSMFRLFSIKRDEETCVSCNKCNKVCPMNVKVSIKKYLRDPHCINCMKCIESCPVKNTLKYEFVLSKGVKKDEEK